MFLPAAFHLLPFPNTFILRSVTPAKRFGFNWTGSPTAATSFIGSSTPRLRSGAALLSKGCLFPPPGQTSIWRSYVIMQMVAMSHWCSLLALLRAQAASPRLSRASAAHAKKTQKRMGWKTKQTACTKTHTHTPTRSFLKQPRLPVTSASSPAPAQQFPTPFARCHSLTHGGDGSRLLHNPAAAANVLLSYGRDEIRAATQKGHAATVYLPPPSHFYDKYSRRDIRTKQARPPRPSGLSGILPSSVRRAVAVKGNKRTLAITRTCK